MSSADNPSKISPESFSEFSHSRNSHFDFFHSEDIDKILFQKRLIPEESDIRKYQNMLIYAYVTENFKPGSFLLEVGNEISPVTNVLNKSGYRCYRLSFIIHDPAKEPTESPEITWTLKDDKGQTVDEIADMTFDFSYSISSFDNIPETEDFFTAILTRVKGYMKPLSYSMNCFLGSANRDNLIWNNKFLDYLNYSNPNSGINTSSISILKDEDLFFLAESYYNKYWKLSEDMSYEKLGRMFSINFLWQYNDPLLIREFQKFTYSKKSHFKLFNETGYSEKLYGKKLTPEDIDIVRYRELMIYSLIKNNFKKGSRILAVGPDSETFKKALNVDYQYFVLKDPGSFRMHVMKSSDKDFPEILDHENNKLEIFPLKYFDFIFSMNEFSSLEHSLINYTNVVANLRTLNKDLGYVLLSFDNIFYNGVAQRNNFLYFLFNYVQKVNKFERHYLMLDDKDLFYMEVNDFFLNRKLDSVKVKMVCYNILWRTIPQLPIVSETRPNHSLQKRPAYFFHHIMKSGGTSVVLTLYKWFKVIFDHTEDPNGIYRNINEYLNYKINLENIYSDTCIAAHFQYEGYLLPQRYPEAILRNKEFRLFTFVRDPLELMISLYYYGRDVIITSLDVYLMGQRNYLANLFPCNIDNYREVLDRYFFIGIVEKMQESFDKLADLTGNRRVELPFVNKSEKDEQILNLSEEFRSKFRKQNELDYRIYEYCLEKFDKL